VTPLDYLAVAGAGLVAGAVNTLAGAGSLLSFPVLVAVGLSPLAANVTNDIGIVPGNASGVISLRGDLAGQVPLLRTLLPLTAAGSLAGGTLLLVAPAHVFEVAAPVLLLLASLLTAAQPRLATWTQRSGKPHAGWMRATIAAVAVYGGYFGTGIGVLFVAVLGLFLHESIRQLNSVKTLLQLVSNGVAGIVFAFVAPVHWTAALVLAVSSSIGAPVGGRLSRVIPAAGLRAVITVVGVGASGYLFWRLR
jgi:uncharacterized membrane protein YfcA